MPFCRTSFQKNLFLPLDGHCCRLLKKYNQISRTGPWSATHDLGGITFRKKGNGLCFRRMLWKSSLYTFTSSLFLILRIYTELIVIIVFDRAENRSALVWETVVWSLSKKSRLFYSHNFRKNYTADCSFFASFRWFFQNIWVVSGRR